jgi:hypothetical protein
VWYRNQQSPGVDQWSGEETLPSDVAGPLASQRNSDGTIEVFATGTDNKIYADRQTGPDTDAWTGWNLIPAGAASLAVTAEANGALELFYIGGDDALWYRYQTTAGTDTWSPEGTVPAYLTP